MRVGVRIATLADLASHRVVAQLGSAFDWGSKGRGFKSRQPDSSLRIGRPERLPIPRYGVGLLTSASPTCYVLACVLTTRSPVRTECARRTRGSSAWARPRVLRFQVRQINCDSKRVIAHPARRLRRRAAFSPLALRRAPSAPVELVARPRSARSGSSAII